MNTKSLDWIKDNRCKADDAIRSLQAAKKQRTAAYDENLRFLKSFAEDLFIKQSHAAQGELFEAEDLLTEKIKVLLDDPQHGCH